MPIMGAYYTDEDDEEDLIEALQLTQYEKAEDQIDTLLLEASVQYKLSQQEDNREKLSQLDF